jgi:hypothetical protein
VHRDLDINVELEIPDRLPRLDPGGHSEGSGRVCAMEAAAWLAGEAWSDTPRSVHAAIARVARQVNDEVSDDVRQTLWPLIFASLDTRAPRHFVLSMRLERFGRLELAAARSRGDMRRAWVAVIDEYARLYGPHRAALSSRRLHELSDHLDAF